MKIRSMKPIFFCITLMIVCSCKNTEKSEEGTKKSSTDISAISTKEFTEFKVLDSKYIDNSKLWEPFNIDLSDFTIDKYNALKPLILEQDIPTLQQHIQDGKLSYEDLTKFYLY